MFLSIVRSIIFFFCKQKTAYEVRISDWSSDVCSSDLTRSHRYRNDGAEPVARPAVPGPAFDGRRRLPYRAVSQGRLCRAQPEAAARIADRGQADRKSTRLNSSH